MTATTRNILAGSVVLLAAILACVLVFSSKPVTERPSPTLTTGPKDEVRDKPQPRPRSVPAAAAADHAAQAAAPTPTAAAAMVQAREAAMVRMNEAAVTYDPAGLPVITPYLVDPDPELRKAAVDAMIVLGDAAAGTLLREAAKKAPSAKEAVVMENAADYVELPSADLSRLKKRFKASSPRPKQPNK